MGLTTSLFTSLSGLNSNSQAINVTGNNISNVNTTAFKASRALFETQISETLSTGTAPTDELGGTNQTQIGLGTRIGAITRNFNDGSIQPTGINTDIAIEGKGFFVLDSAGEQRFTRAGTFDLNSDFNLVNPDGGLLQGFGIDEDFNIVEGVLQDINIPIGALSLAERTQNLQFAGNLNSGGDVSTTGSVIASDLIFSDAGATIPAVDTDGLDTLFDDTGASLFSLGDIITITGVTKGGATIPDATFEVNPTNTTASDAFGTTVDEFLTFFEDLLGLEDTGVGTSGVSIVGGAITFDGDLGTANDLEIDRGNIITNISTNPVLPFDFTKSQEADGESVRTTFVAFDSLGTPLTMELRAVLESKTNSGTTWRYFVNSEDNTGPSSFLGTGTLRFDTEGQLLSTSSEPVLINRDGTGAFTPQQINLNFGGGADEGAVSALSDVNSQVATTNQDGAPLGTLQDFSIGDDGAIVGVFSNSLERNLGKIVLATFTNPQGLLEAGGNLFTSTATSGTASISSPTTSGAGRIIGGAIELSNVDLSQEFINLIIQSTGFSANSRVLTTSDRLIQELLSTVR